MVPPGSVIDGDANNTLHRVFQAGLLGCASPGRNNAYFTPSVNEVDMERYREIQRDAARILAVRRVRPIAGADQHYAVELEVPIERYALDPNPLRLRFVFPDAAPAR